jgi:hypothetical protein
LLYPAAPPCGCRDHLFQDSARPLENVGACIHKSSGTTKECRYSGEELDMPATMTLLKAFNEFTGLRPARSLVFAPIGYANQVGEKQHPSAA